MRVPEVNRMREECVYLCEETGDLLKCIYAPDVDDKSDIRKGGQPIYFERLHDGRTIMALWREREKFARLAEIRAINYPE